MCVCVCVCVLLDTQDLLNCFLDLDFCSVLYNSGNMSCNNVATTSYLL